MINREKVYLLRTMIEKASASLPDEDALEAVELFPAWQAGTSYAVGVRIRYGGKTMVYATDFEHEEPCFSDLVEFCRGADLVLSGHVHGGIVVLPFIGGLYTNEEGFFPKFSAGQYVLANGQTLIISAGLGDSKSFPPRINNTPELTVIDINR